MLIDPRTLSDWKDIESSVVLLVTLKDHERDMSLSTLSVLYPCPPLLASVAAQTVLR